MLNGVVFVLVEIVSYLVELAIKMTQLVRFGGFFLLDEFQVEGLLTSISKWQ